MSKGVRISWHPCQLILFSLLLLVGCVKSQDASKTKITLLRKNGRAIGLSIPLRQLAAIPEADIPKLLKVQLAASTFKTAILGEYTIGKDSVIFEPLIPFTEGLRYEVFLENRLLSEIEIPRPIGSPELVGMYPTQDTLPENLLKFYFVFSRPMAEGHSLQYITLLDAKGDTLPNTFLNLQPELWNAERTILTLWLDPGRIKRDLQPNKLLGAPLTEGKHYTLWVSDQWPDEQGATLKKTYTKNFVVTARDITSPKIKDWTLNIPPKGTVQPLEVTIKEALDHILLQNTIRIVDTGGNTMNGLIQVNDRGNSILFTPAKPWLVGSYKLMIESRLEDLAGNNLNRLFDRDITNKETLPSDKKVFELPWRIN
ncbi:hypothetical protein [Runella sp.]|uniref:hypothetical protein n=1 Tax=Runella sp. TaxID=1960881 RepID=UPI003D143D11